MKWKGGGWSGRRRGGGCRCGGGVAVGAGAGDADLRRAERRVRALGDGLQQRRHCTPWTASGRGCGRGAAVDGLEDGLVRREVREPQERRDLVERQVRPDDAGRAARRRRRRGHGRPWRPPERQRAGEVVLQAVRRVARGDAAAAKTISAARLAAGRSPSAAGPRTPAASPASTAPPPQRHADHRHPQRRRRPRHRRRHCSCSHRCCYPCQKTTRSGVTGACRRRRRSRRRHHHHHQSYYNDGELPEKVAAAAARGEEEREHRRRAGLIGRASVHVQHLGLQLQLP